MRAYQLRFVAGQGVAKFGIENTDHSDQEHLAQQNKVIIPSIVQILSQMFTSPYPGSARSLSFSVSMTNV